MAELLSALPQLAGVIEKLGVIGVLLIISGVLGWEVFRLRQQNAITFRQRDRWRLAYTIVKASADAAGAKYDLRDLKDLEEVDPA